MRRGTRGVGAALSSPPVFVFFVIKRSAAPSGRRARKVDVWNVEAERLWHREKDGLGPLRRSAGAGVRNRDVRRGDAPPADRGVGGSQEKSSPSQELPARPSAGCHARSGVGFARLRPWFRHPLEGVAPGI